ncbi:MAG: FeoB-associated Cys-rich membrane protein [Gammaproteobacteria bacterium]|nr:FeoB-associated Cys-rich membrane protein [Gammaproteobacteria bacterium]
MPGFQEIVALAIVALIVGLYIRRRWSRGKAARRAGDCGDCPASEPPPKESTVHFYRRRDSADSSDGD